MNKAVLLVNLGTPDAPTTAAVRRYLKEFLMDPYVIDRPYWLRFLLVNAVIAPFRAPKSRAAYEKIWTKAGSPLLWHSRQLQAALQQRLGSQLPVALGMRYGNPSILAALTELQRQGIREVYAIPLYPQFADSSTQTAVDAIYSAAEKLTLSIHIEPPFYRRQEFIAAHLALLAPVLSAAPPDKVLFSFHGIPEEHIIKHEPACRSCLRSKHCQMSESEKCYRSQCFQTAKLISAQAKLTEQQYQVAFQSRLGRLPWIRPYTDEVITELARSGTKKLLVICAAFTADCLETIEEIGIENKKLFLAAGGKSFQLLPCLNASPAWVEALAQWTGKQFSQ